MIGKQGVSLIIGHNGVQDKTTLNPANETVARGIYDATTLSTVDAELATVNIKAGITIFGFAGPATVQDISGADAAVGDVKDTVTFFSVTGTIKTGTMATRTLNPDNETVLAGYYAATTLSTVDIHLAAANIKQGVTIFGFLGTVIQAGVETIERVTVENIADGAAYTPGVAGLFMASYIKMQHIASELFSTAEAGWEAMNIGTPVRIFVVGDGTNLRFVNNTGAQREIVVFRFHRSDKTYERHKDEGIAGGANYVPAAAGYYSSSYASGWVFSEHQGTIWGVYFADSELQGVIGDGTNYRIRNASGEEKPYVLLREV